MIFSALGLMLMMVRTLWKNRTKGCIKCELRTAFGTLGMEYGKIIRTEFTSILGLLLTLKLISGGKSKQVNIYKIHMLFRGLMVGQMLRAVCLQNKFPILA